MFLLQPIYKYFSQSKAKHHRLYSEDFEEYEEN